MTAGKEGKSNPTRFEFSMSKRLNSFFLARYAGLAPALACYGLTDLSRIG